MNLLFTDSSDINKTDYYSTGNGILKIVTYFINNGLVGFNAEFYCRHTNTWSKMYYNTIEVELTYDKDRLRKVQDLEEYAKTYNSYLEKCIMLLDS